MRLLLSSHGASLFGAERVLLAIAAGLVGRGHDVTLELPHEGRALAAAQRLSLHVVVSGRSRLPRNSREIVHYVTGFRRSVHCVRSVIRSADYDVVWVNSIYNPPASRAARREGVAVAWHLHERNFRGAAAALAVHWIRRHCDIALAPSRFVADSFTSSGLPASHMRVLPNALLRPVTAGSARSHDGSFVVGYIGQLEPRKRTGDLLEAVARLDDVSALLVGDGKARHAVEAAIDRLDLTGRVRLTGFHEDVRPFLAGCDCIVIPSPDEAFGLVALEAMAAGLPVIAVRSGALPDVLGPAALYFPVGDVAALAACLRQLREETSRAAKLRECGLARVKEHSLDRMLDGVESAAHEAIARRRGTRAVEVHA